MPRDAKRGRARRPAAASRGRRSTGAHPAWRASIEVACVGVALVGAVVVGRTGVVSAPTADAAPVFRHSPLEPLLDSIEVIVRDRELLAVDARGTGLLRQRLASGEPVLWSQARGRIGVAITDRRMLAVTPESAKWSVLSFRLAEAMPDGALVTERVGVIVTDQRVVGIAGLAGELFAEELGPHEDVVDAGARENVAVVVTERRALGLSGTAGGFTSIELGVRERVQGLSTSPDFATLTTNRRLLVFRGASGTWEARELSIR